jgi:nucleoside-diphosphate-sugar epimerase
MQFISNWISKNKICYLDVADSQITFTRKESFMSENFQIPAGTSVLVTGATGFTGSVLVQKLVKGGIKVSVIARPSSKTDHLSNLPIKWYRGHVFDPETVKSACSGVQYVFHIAAAFREARYDDEYYYNVHVKSTQLLAQEVLQNPEFKRFIHISTVGVHGHIENPPANEDSPFNPGDIYQKTKAEADIWIRNFAKERDLSLTVIRPAAIYGPGDRRLLKLFRAVNRGIFPILGYGKCLYHLIHVEDLTNVMMLAAVHPRAEGQVFIAGNSEPIALTEMVRIIADELGSKPRIIRLPVAPFFVIADICESLCRPLGIEPPIYRRRVAFFTKDRAFDTSKLRNILGYRYVFTNEEGLRQTARWYVQQGWIKARVHK